MAQQGAANAVRDPIAEAIERAKTTGEEFCNCCGMGMGFPLATTYVDDPIRFENGAFYREGAGQTCGDCEATIPKSFN